MLPIETPPLTTLWYLVLGMPSDHHRRSDGGRRHVLVLAGGLEETVGLEAVLLDVAHPADALPLVGHQTHTARERDRHLGRVAFPILR